MAHVICRRTVTHVTAIPATQDWTATKVCKQFKSITAKFNKMISQNFEIWEEYKLNKKKKALHFPNKRFFWKTGGYEEIEKKKSSGITSQLYV